MGWVAGGLGVRPGHARRRVQLHEALGNPGLAHTAEARITPEGIATSQPMNLFREHENNPRFGGHET